MARLISSFDISNIVPEEGTPEPDRVLDGRPRTRTWNVEESDDGKTFAGVWEATPGTWRIAYDEWEFFRIESGLSIVTSDDGESTRLGPGDSLVIRPGFVGTWEVVETTRKLYVIRLP